MSTANAAKRFCNKCGNPYEDGYRICKICTPSQPLAKREPDIQVSWGTAFKLAFAFVIVFGLVGGCVTMFGLAVAS